MKKIIKFKKIMPFILSSLWIFFALCVVLTPKTSGTQMGLVRNFFQQFEYLVYDIRQLSSTNVMPLTSPPIVIIAIDNKSIQQEGEWPWSYSKIANLIAKLREQGVSVFAFDLPFTDAEANVASIVKNKLLKMNVDKAALIKELGQLEPEFDDNAKLIQQVQNKNDIVLPFYLNATHDKQGILPTPIVVLDRDDLNKTSILSASGFITNFAELQQVSAHNGFISNLTENNVIRSIPLLIRYHDKVYPSLALAVAEILLSKYDVKLNNVDHADKNYLTSVQLGERNIPTDEYGQVLIPFRGKAHGFKYYSATDVLKNKLKPNELKHSVAFVGRTADGFAGFSSNIEIQANVLSGILDNKLPYVAYWGNAVVIGLILVIGITLALLLPQLSPALSVLLASFVLVSLAIANLWLWLVDDIAFSVAIPVFMTVMLVLTNMAYGFLFESRKNKFLRNVFNQYVPPEHVKLLLENPDKFNLDGESVELSVLFADIRNFTTISENLDATEVKKMLNQYLTPMTSIIFKHGGTIDKYVGDMIMAFWGAPIKNARHREAAIDAALDMLAQSEKIKDSFRKSGLPDINIGIGINSGLMNVGDMGSEYRRAYTVLGDPVNLGARLESSTKYYGIKLLVGSATRAGQTKFLFRLIDKVKVQGKHVPVDIYEVVCRMDAASPALLYEVAEHEQALAAYFSGDWLLACKQFRSLADQHPDKVFYKLFLDRIAHFEQHPPSLDWDGSYELKEK